MTSLFTPHVIYSAECVLAGTAKSSSIVSVFRMQWGLVPQRGPRALWLKAAAVDGQAVGAVILREGTPQLEIQASALIIWQKWQRKRARTQHCPACICADRVFLTVAIESYQASPQPTAPQRDLSCQGAVTLPHISELTRDAGKKRNC